MKTIFCHCPAKNVRYACMLYFAHIYHAVNSEITIPLNRVITLLTWRDQEFDAPSHLIK